MSGNLLNRIPGFNEAMRAALNEVEENPAVDAVLEGMRGDQGSHDKGAAEQEATKASGLPPTR